MIRLTTNPILPPALSTTKNRQRARYVNWTTLLQTNPFLNQTFFKSFIQPENITDYSRWVKRQKRVKFLEEFFFSNQFEFLFSSLSKQIDLFSTLFDPSRLLSTAPTSRGSSADFLRFFNGFPPEVFELICISPLMNLIPNDPVLKYIFGVGRVFELINTFMTIITSTNRIRCHRNVNEDYNELSQFLRLNKTVGIVRKQKENSRWFSLSVVSSLKIRDLVKNRFQSTFSCSLIVDVLKNIQVYQNLVYIMQHDSIKHDTIDCLTNTLLQTLERLKIIPGLARFVLSDLSLFQTLQRLTPLIQLFAPALSPDSHKFIQIDDMIEHSSNFTAFLKRRRNITSLEKWFFNSRLVSWKFERSNSILSRFSLRGSFAVGLGLGKDFLRQGADRRLHCGVQRHSEHARMESLRDDKSLHRNSSRIRRTTRPAGRN